jgi:hypothetical protein
MKYHSNPEFAFDIYPDFLQPPHDDNLLTLVVIVLAVAGCLLTHFVR